MSLLRQACFEGLIDPAKANTLDRTWWWRLHRVFGYLEDKNQLEIFKLLHLRHCSAIDYSTEQKTLDHHWEWAGKLQSMMSGILLPWVPIADKKARIKAMSDAWEKHYGDYDDPAVKAKVEAACARMQEIAAQGRKRNNKRWSRANGR